MNNKEQKAETSTDAAIVGNTVSAVLSYVKEKIAIVEQMEKEDKGTDYGHSQFLSGLGNAYEDIRFQLEDGLFKHSS
jgi:hypothetical protein